jgi:hypothetical protein
LKNFVGSILFAAVILVCSTVATAQTAFSATSSCGTADVHQTIVIADEGQHSVSIDQRVCRWTAPLTLAGQTSTEYVASGVDDVQFDKSHDSGYTVGTTATGDKYFLRYDGTATLKNNVPVQLSGEWKFTGGTGKLKGLTGRGTYTAQPTAAGGMVFVIKGEYKII